MSELRTSAVDPMDHPREIARLNKIITVLMDRAERNANVPACELSEYSRFEARILLEDEVRRRTRALQQALRENEKITRALRESETKFRGVVSQSLVGIVTIENERFTYSNERFTEMFGYTDEEILTLGPLDMVVESDRALVARQLHARISGTLNSAHFTFRGRRKDGAVRDIECFGNAVDINGARVLISVTMDVTERISNERAVEQLQASLLHESVHDPLTGLYNRRYLDEYLARTLDGDGTPHALTAIMGDLDHFKAVNDRLGHLAGDDVLRTFGAIMKAHARQQDVYCRYGGEEFLLVLPGISKDGARQRAEDLRATIASTPIIHNGTSISITASFGVACVPDDGVSGDELIAAADRALYAAKIAGRDRVEIAGPSLMARGA